MSDFKQLTVVSGKGGTGKTTLVGAFAALARRKVLADCDVDAADLHLLLNPKIRKEKDFRALKTAVIDESKCTRCGRCVEHCRFDAIRDFKVEPLSCEGCAVCTLVCPENAVSMEDKVAGKKYVSDTRYGPLCHARLNPGEEASGRLVAEVRGDAIKIAGKQNLGLVIIDGSPGIGCPVIASIVGVDLTLVVTEPTVSGVHDLKRILGVAEHFKVEAVVCVNKYDINLDKTNEIKDYCEKNNIEVVGLIPYDLAFTKAMVEGKTIIEYTDNSTSKHIEDIWGKVEVKLK